MSEITVQYGDFLIFYGEHDNTWVPKRSSGSLPGCASLEKAKLSIDALGKQEKSTFKRHPAIFMPNDYSDPVRVEVTSFVAKTDHRPERRLYAWIKLSDGQRRCESVGTLREFTALNVHRLDDLEKLKAKYTALREQSNSIRKEISGYGLKPAKELYSSGRVPEDLVALLPK